MTVKDLPNDVYRLDMEAQVNDALDFINKYHLVDTYPILFIQETKDGLPSKVWGIFIQNLIKGQHMEGWGPETTVDLLYNLEDENG